MRGDRAGPAPDAQAHVSILMATRNGAAFLPGQLASIAAQSHRNWTLWVSDDGSTDATLDLVQDFARHHPVRLVSGPLRGAATNFLTLLMHPDLPPGMVAFADQDDVWLHGKLAAAVARLAQTDPGTPGLYAADSIAVDAALRPLRCQRPRCHRPHRLAPGFANALVQNRFSGHTLMLNAAAVTLARAAGVPHGVRFHDWWLYQLVAGAGGDLWRDTHIAALYRQHRANAHGAPIGPRAGLGRLAGLFGGDWGDAMRAHARALHRVADLLTPASRDLLTAYLDGFAPRGPARVGAYLRHGLIRSSPCHTLALLIGAFLGRV